MPSNAHINSFNVASYKLPRIFMPLKVVVITWSNRKESVKNNKDEGILAQLNRIKGSQGENDS